MSVPKANLQLSEILYGLVDRGEISEGSPDYLLAQKVVREGFHALEPNEQEAFRTRVEPLLDKPTEQSAAASDIREPDTTNLSQKPPPLK